jgi:hypothetical protein
MSVRCRIEEFKVHSNRPDLFTTIHKGIRWWMGDVSARLGATDYLDAAAASRSLDELGRFLDMLDAHSEHEHTFIAPYLDERAPERSRVLHQEHSDLNDLTQTLRRQASALGVLAPGHEMSANMGLALYRAFGRYSSTVLHHLDSEETVLMPLLWSICTDEELGGIMTAFRARHGAESAVIYARVALAFSPQERAILGV